MKDIDWTEDWYEEEKDNILVDDILVGDIISINSFKECFHNITKVEDILEDRIVMVDVPYPFSYHKISNITFHMDKRYMYDISLIKREI